MEACYSTTETMVAASERLDKAHPKEFELDLESSCLFDLSQLALFLFSKPLQRNRGYGSSL